MKIFVSPAMFENEFAKFKEPMEQTKMYTVDKSLKLGQIIVDTEDGSKYLITLNDNNEFLVEQIKER